MFFIGIVSEEKNEKHIKDILKQKIENENVVFINEKNIENIKNIKFKIIVLNKGIDNKNIKNILLNAEYLILNSDINVFKAKIDNNLVKYIGVDYFGNSAVACQPFYKLLAEDWKIWKNKIHEYCEKGNVDVYAENALNELTNEIQLNPLDIHGDLCSEVDTVEDLNNVKGIL